MDRPSAAASPTRVNPAYSFATVREAEIINRKYPLLSLRPSFLLQYRIITRQATFKLAGNECYLPSVSAITSARHTVLRARRYQSEDYWLIVHYARSEWLEIDIHSTMPES